MTFSKLNMNFKEKVIIDTMSMQWTQSPKKGVQRKRLEVEDVESGHVTSIVKYDSGSSFNEHLHHGGEEILVLKGTFSDETGDYKAGTYIRNPPGSSHTPFSHDGCIIFVKLHQMQKSGENNLAINTNKITFVKSDAVGHSSYSLYHSKFESVALEKLITKTQLELEVNSSGYELLLLEGSLSLDNEKINPLTWVRLPEGKYKINAHTTCTFWSKQGHLNST